MQGHTIDVICSAFISKYRSCPVWKRGSLVIKGHDFKIRIVVTQHWPKVLADKISLGLSGEYKILPGSWIPSWLVLSSDTPEMDTFCFICFKKFAEIFGICLLNLRVFAKDWISSSFP